MIFEVDDAWAENELERQLRSLTPIDDLEEAENKLSLLKSYRKDDDLNFETAGNVQSVTDDILPESAELFFSLIQHTSNAVEQELLECQTLIDKQIEQYTIKTESEENEDDWEEEFILTTNTDLMAESSPVDDGSTSSDQDADGRTFTSYQLKVQSDLPIYQVSQVSVSSQANTEESNMAKIEAEKERKERELERSKKMEAERMRLEALQKCKHLIERQSDAKELRQRIVRDDLCHLSVSGVKVSEEEEETKTNNTEGPEVTQQDDEVNEQENGVGDNKVEDGGLIFADVNNQNEISKHRNGEVESHDKIVSHVTAPTNKISSHETVRMSRDTLMTSRVNSAVLLQSLLRGFKARLRYQNMVDEAQLKVYREYQEMVAASLVIQRIWRGYSTRNLLWQWLPWLHRRQELLARQHKSAITIQSVYRGYLLRRRLSEVLSQAVYDLSDCEDLDDFVSVDYDETECEKGWGLPPTPSLQHHVPLPPSRSSSLASTQRSITDLSQGPVPLLPLNKLRSRDTTRANSLRSVSDISVLSLPPSRRHTPSKRHVAMAAEWGVTNQETVQKLVQRSKKFGKHVSEKRKRELIRQKILEGSKRTSQAENHPPPPTAGSALSSDSVVYQWDDSPLHHSSRRSKHTSTHAKRSPHDKQTLHTQVYRNPKFYDAANNVRLPPLVKKPERPNYSVFR